MRRRRRGFTLVELLVVVGIIAMLATMLVPRVFKGMGKAKTDIARAKMAVIEDSLARFQYDCGRLPDEAEGGLECLLAPPAGLEDKWNGPYLKKSQLLDPWGNEYQYLAEGQTNVGSYDIISYGADGAEGGEGDNADIVNE
ncbi:MAG TPA: type II secretion system major pseudopilin GspG [Sedimentisphaerales bacterium]|jgi:general secretion pathway protein G|nr:type II secretion system major pseudopilin GspG [Sedimentisphaerales bacterium]HNU29489.1 type II secretion system major pseudopilin GspG [Sedimentisphaerales bacterium]